METITNNYDAFVMALTLALTAPSEEKSAAAIVIAEGIALCLTPEDINRAKYEALIACGLCPEIK